MNNMMTLGLLVQGLGKGNLVRKLRFVMAPVMAPARLFSSSGPTTCNATCCEEVQEMADQVKSAVWLLNCFQGAVSVNVAKTESRTRFVGHEHESKLTVPFFKGDGHPMIPVF